MSPHAIRHIRVTPIAFRDPPLLNAAGIHEPWALRSIIEVQTSDGRVGLGESYGDLQTLVNLNKVAPLLHGLSPFDLNGLTRLVYAEVGGNPDTGADYPVAGDKARASAVASVRPGLRRANVVWSGTPTSRPNSTVTERSRPSVCRHGRPKAWRSRCPVSIIITSIENSRPILLATSPVQTDRMTEATGGQVCGSAIRVAKRVCR